MTDQLQAERLAAELVWAKEQEEKAREERIAIESALIECLGQKDEGSKTHTVGQWAVTITAKINRSMDWKQWDQVSLKVPQNIWPVKVKPELDLKGLRWLKENEPEIYGMVSSCVTSKPAKTAVSVKLKES